MKLPHITIIICTYNRAKMLAKAIESLCIQETDEKFAYEILIIDDGSTDNTKDIVKTLANRFNITLRYILNDRKGYPYAMNRGVKESHGQWVAFFDDDQLTDSNWLQELFLVAIRQGIDLVAGTRVLKMPETELSKLGPICRSLFGEVNTAKTRARRRYFRSEIDLGGGNLLIKRKVFDSIGFFNEKMRRGCDFDLVQRAKAAGFNIGWAPKAIIQHVVPSYRIETNSIRWHSLHVGFAFAYVDWQQWGKWKTLLASIARIGRELFINFPLLFHGYIKCSDREKLDCRALFWRDMGYACKTLSLFVPRLFSKKRYFENFN